MNTIDQNTTFWPADIAEMHAKFGVNRVVNGLSAEQLNTYLKFRLDMVQEEVDEAKKAFNEKDADGIVDALLLGETPLMLVLGAKAFAHWLVTGLPVTLIAVVLGVMFDLGGDRTATLTASLALGTPALAQSPAAAPPPPTSTSCARTTPATATPSPSNTSTTRWKPRPSSRKRSSIPGRHRRHEPPLYPPHPGVCCRHPRGAGACPLRSGQRRPSTLRT